MYGALECDPQGGLDCSFIYRVEEQQLVTSRISSAMIYQSAAKLIVLLVFLVALEIWRTFC